MDAVSATTPEVAQVGQLLPPPQSPPDLPKEVDPRPTITSVLLSAAIDEFDELVHTMHNMVGNREEPGDHESLDDSAAQITAYLNAIYLWEMEEGINITVITVRVPIQPRAMKFAIPNSNNRQRRAIAEHIADELKHRFNIKPVTEYNHVNLEILPLLFPSVQFEIDTGIPFIYSVE